MKKRIVSFVRWGETSSAKEATEKLVGRTGGECESFEMPGTGHNFAPSGKAKAKGGWNRSNSSNTRKVVKY